MADNNPTVPDRIENDYSRQYVSRQHVNFSYKMDAVRRGLEALAPQPYQYRKQGAEAYLKAMTEHGLRLYKLAAVQDELRAIWMAIDPPDQRETGGRRRATEESKED